MFWSRQRLKEMAKVALHGSYWKSVFASLIVTLVLGASLGSRRIIEYRFEVGSSPQVVLANGVRLPAIFLLAAFIFAVAGAAVFIALSILVFWPAEVGCRAYFDEALYAPADLRLIGKGFGPEYMNVMKIQLKRYVYTFLWSLLLVVPGIMKYYEYSMMPYLLAENPGMDEKECFRMSKAMMNGEKWEAFLLDLSFIGWILLSGVTAGIAWYFYAGPYYELTWAGLFGALKVKMSNGGADQAAGFGGQADLSRMGPSEGTAPAGETAPSEDEIPPVAEFTAIHDPAPFPQPPTSEEPAAVEQDASSGDYEDVPEAEYTVVPEADAAETEYVSDVQEEMPDTAGTEYVSSAEEALPDSSGTEYVSSAEEAVPDAPWAAYESIAPAEEPAAADHAETESISQEETAEFTTPETEEENIIPEVSPEADAEEAPIGEEDHTGEMADPFAGVTADTAESSEESAAAKKGYEPAPWEIYAASNPAPWETEVPAADAADGLKESTDPAETPGQNGNNPFEI